MQTLAKMPAETAMNSFYSHVVFEMTPLLQNLCMYSIFGILVENNATKNRVKVSAFTVPTEANNQQQEVINFARNTFLKLVFNCFGFRSETVACMLIIICH